MIGRSKYSICFGALLCASVLSVSPLAISSRAEAATKEDRVRYTFKRGDTLIDLAEKYMRKRSDYVIVQRLNRIKDPFRIPVGKTVVIPFRLLKSRASQASISAFRGDVAISSKGQILAPTKGLRLTEGSRLATAGRSSLTLRLEDGSRISMPSNSKVRINRLRHVLLTDSVDYEFSVDSGRMRSKVTPFDRKPGRYRVRTPVAVSAVRGTDYRTRFDEATGTAFSETIEGEIGVATGDDANSTSAVSVVAGKGAAAKGSGELMQEDLLAPPELLDPAKVQSEAELEFAIKPVGDAVGNRVLISSDAGFVDLVGEKISNGNVVTLEGLPNGRYFAKASSIADSGFEGMPATYAFKRQLSTLSGSSEQGDFGYRFKWDGEGEGKRLYRFQLLRGSKTGVPIVDEVALTTDLLTLSDLPDGEYYWRVGVTQFSDDAKEPGAFQKWTEFEKLTVAG